MGRARALSMPNGRPMPLSRSRWSAAHALKEIEEAEAAGKRKNR